MLFKDWETAKKILSTSQPSEQKKLGRQVRNFDEEVWRKHRFEIVKAGNAAKVIIITCIVLLIWVIERATSYCTGSYVELRPGPKVLVVS